MFYNIFQSAASLKNNDNWAAGNVEAIDQAIKSLAKQYLMIVLEDDANLSSLDMSSNIMAGFNSNKNESIHSFLNGLQQLPIGNQGQSKTGAEESIDEAVNSVSPAPEFEMNRSTKFVKDIGSLYVDCTRDWIKKLQHMWINC